MADATDVLLEVSQEFCNAVHPVLLDDTGRAEGRRIFDGTIGKNLPVWEDDAIKQHLLTHIRSIGRASAAASVGSKVTGPVLLDEALKVMKASLKTGCEPLNPDGTPLRDTGEDSARLRAIFSRTLPSVCDEFIKKNTPPRPVPPASRP